jgi:hypothetical protein
MPLMKDGPASPLFRALTLDGNMSLDRLADANVSQEMVDSAKFAPTGSCVHWGIPFETDSLVMTTDAPVSIDLSGVEAPWLVIDHVVDLSEQNQDIDEYASFGSLSMPLYRAVPIDHVADYVFVYADGTRTRSKIVRRHQIQPFATRWGENCFEAVSHFKPMPTRWGKDDLVANQQWGFLQMQATRADMVRLWVNWLWAWRNPHPDKALSHLEIEPVSDPLLVFGISAGDVSGIPTRWQSRRKALLELPAEQPFDDSLKYHGTEGVLMEEGIGGYRHVKMDMGQIISIVPRTIYPNADWQDTGNNELPERSTREVIVEYSAHNDAHFHLPDGGLIPLRELTINRSAGPFQEIAAAKKRIRIRAVDSRTGRPVAVKLHIHGESGEYLPPMNRHRSPNAHWFQDYSVDYAHKLTHFCSYIDGEAEVMLPQGRVFVEVSKGFEVMPVRKVVTIDIDTQQIELELDKVLDWRSRGWVTADTHVHFLSPQTAMLEGAGEGVNVVNLLASQWGELFTNIGDFDGHTTFGADAKGEGEWLVRVGSENRQGVLGHISLLGYEDEMILPLCVDGPGEAAIGDPVNALLTDWATRCKAQNGTVVVPHFPSPHAEHAAAILSGHVDGVELTSLIDQARGGLSPYSLSDWYRYLNCGYFVAAVGGTDKMSANIAVGAGRTYARLENDETLTYQAWQRAIASGRTFVTFGPLVDFTVDGRLPGARLRMPRNGGKVDVDWKAESLIIPMTRAELIVNGEVRESKSIDSRSDSGHWTVELKRSSWLAILIRGREIPANPRSLSMRGQNATITGGDAELISAHTSPVMVEVDGSDFMAAADAMTILQQIEGSLAYFDTLGTRADTETYRRLRLMLTSVHRELHNRLHRHGVHHDHTPVADHEEHRVAADDG